MDFKKLYNALAKKAKSRNETFTFMEGDPRKFGHGAPDPDWALMTIREGVKHGLVSQQQADDMNRQFEPHAKFEHTASGEVLVRAHNRNGKPVAAHTRSAPDGTPAANHTSIESRTPPFAPQHYPPLGTPANFPDVMSGQPQAKYPNIRPLSLDAESASLPTPSPTSSSGGDASQPGLLSSILSNMNINNSPSGNMLATSIQGIGTYHQGANAIKTDIKNYFPNVDGADLKEAEQILGNYSSNLSRELLLQVGWEQQLDNTGRLGRSNIQVIPDEAFKNGDYTTIKKSDYFKLLKVLNRQK